jgi:hypothetical protein
VLPDCDGAAGPPPVLGSVAPPIPVAGVAGPLADRASNLRRRPRSGAGRRARPLSLLFLVASLLSASALAAGPATWAGGGVAPSPSGARPADLGPDLPPTQPPMAGAGAGAGAGRPWVRPEPITTSGGQGAGASGEVFRFRGDKTTQQAPGVESPLAPGYRFRPLTEAEQERAEDVAGWRPLGRDGRRSQAPPQEPPREDDAYGYQSDSWFRKYYGDRP